MRRLCLSLLAAAATAFATPVAGQVALAGHAGTLGVGVDASFGLGEYLGIRGGVNVQPLDPSRRFEDIDFTLDLSSPTFTALVDLHPGLGGFRLTGGAVFFRTSHAVRGEPLATVEIGGQAYSPQDIGILSGEFVTREVAPYAGIGFGRLGGRRGPGLVLDLGVAFQGEPDVQLSASGPIAQVPEFQTNLDAEEREIAYDVRAFRFFPVLSLGFVFGF